MTIAAAKELPVTRRFLAARITVGYQPTNTKWTAHTATQYWTAQPYLVAAVYHNGVAILDGGSLAAVDATHYFHDIQAGRLYVQDAAGVPNGSQLRVWVIHYWLFVTENETKQASTTPLALATRGIEYEPRIIGDTVLSQSYENLLAGILTVSDATLQLASADDWALPHLARDRSFANKDVDIWYCLDTIDNAQLAFQGKTRSVSYTGGVLNLGLYDAFSRLNQPCYMGDSLDQCVYSRASSLYPLIPPKDDGLPIRYIAGMRSYVKWAAGGNLGGITQTYHITPDAADAYDGVCTSYTQTIATNTNRTWALCRILGPTLRTQTIGTITAQANLIFAGTNYWFLNIASHDLVPGEYFQWQDGGGTTYAIVAGIDDFIYLGNPYNVIVFTINAGALAGPISAGATVTALALPTLVFSQGALRRYVPPNLFSVIYDATDGGNKLIRITLTNNWEGLAVSGLPNPVNPETDTLRFLAINDGVLTFAKSAHVFVARDILQRAGMTATIGLAPGDPLYSRRLIMDIPNVDETDYRQYREYLADVLSSMGTYVRLDSTSTALYSQLDAAAAASSTVTEAEFLRDTLGLGLDYGDLTHELRGTNPHHPTWEVTNTSTPGHPAETATDLYSRYLHDYSNSIVFRHVQEQLRGRLTYLLSLRAAPKRAYGIATASKQIDVELGDSVTIESSQIVGGTVTARVSGLARSTETIETQALEI